MEGQRSISRNNCVLGNEMAFIAVVDDLFSPEECARFIQLLSTGEQVQVDSGMAKYLRVTLLDRMLAADVFQKLQHVIPPEFNVVSANEVFRFSTYEEGGEFKMHMDGINQDASGARSVITVNVFLNGSDSFNGGSTDFFHQDKSFRLSVTPAAGRAAVFDSQQFHCGCPVTGGQKYLMRTDLMSRV